MKCLIIDIEKMNLCNNYDRLGNNDRAQFGNHVSIFDTC